MTYNVFGGTLSLTQSISHTAQLGTFQRLFGSILGLTRRLLACGVVVQLLVIVSDSRSKCCGFDFRSSAVT